MQTKDQLICLWLVPFFGLAFLFAFWNANGFFPPMSPTMTAEEVATFYQDNLASIRSSMILCNIIGLSLVPFYMVIIVQMMRMVHASRVFSYSYLIAVVNGGTMFALADLAWLNAAFRPDRDPQLTMLLNDLAWFAFITPVGFFIVQNFCLAMAILFDKSAQPVFPRWVAHFNIVTALLVAPSACALIYKTGPLAWDGAISFWLHMTTYVCYVAVMFIVTRAAVIRQATESSTHPQTWQEQAA
ncbi:hypothetical protein [Ketobacter sp.]|uniref:hypothetical protein n=1 Tax=Ketobacter sp. TaxID=2083498 RepID=UPI000F14CDB6|nr:hypothetical protein [Ketobacter sp.]RLT95630.1 MAG: hypothetical protein D9N14_14325 [Ketobacter sp.]